MPKLTWEEWSKLTRDEQKEAILRFEEPENLYRPVWLNNSLLKEEKV